MRLYVQPDLEIQKIKLKDSICSSVEYFSSYIDGPGNWEDPTFDPDDEIIGKI